MPGVLSTGQVAKLQDEFSVIFNTSSGSGAGKRNLLSHPTLNQLASNPRLLDICSDILGSKTQAVKITLFDKTATTNWKVPPHHDVTIAAKQKKEVPGFNSWTEKGGIPHVQPPSCALKSMLAIRLHLDSADENNGALKVWPGSHLHGRLKDSGIRSWIDTQSPKTCTVESRQCNAHAPITDPRIIASQNPTPSPRNPYRIRRNGIDHYWRYYNSAKNN